MAGLPHYKNSKISMQLGEPVYQNLFEVIVTPPASVSGWDQLVLDNVKKIGGLETEKVPGMVEQIYKGAKRRFSGALAESTTVDINIEFEVNLNESNSMYVYKALRKWSDLVWDPLTGAMTLKKDYVGGPMTISVHNRAGDIFRQWVFPKVWPMSALPAMELDYSSGTNIWSVAMTFASDYWEDMSI